MKLSGDYVPLLLALLWLPAMSGCAATPLQVVKAEAGVDFKRYTTLVVKDFQDGVGDALPAQVLRELPDDAEVMYKKAATLDMNDMYLKAISSVRQAKEDRKKLVEQQRSAQ
jgi:hypothetical protein